MERVY